MTVTIPEPDGCLWPLDPSCLKDEWEGFDAPVQERAQALASATLRRLCAFRVGGCPVTVRPCPPRPTGYMYGPPYHGYVPQNWAGTWSNCTCVGPCRHNPATSVKLPPPVYSVVEVKVDGAVVDDANYWVSDDHLIGLGSQTWPLTQNLDLPSTEPGTFEVTYYDSAPVDGMGAYAAAKLAIQYGRACSGSNCDLPETVTSIARQGVTYEIPAGSFPNGETGIREVDAYIGLWNPVMANGKHRRNRTRVWTPT
jgi:hypothetical protein